METAEDPNGDLMKLMYSLVERFNALKEDVEHLKGGVIGVHKYTCLCASRQRQYL